MEQYRHPLVDLIEEYYYSSFPKSKEKNIDLSNFEFNKNFGFFIDCPIDWPYIDAIQNILLRPDMIQEIPNVVIIYSWTELYDKIKLQLNNLVNISIKYISWSDIFVGISRQDADLRLIQSVKEKFNKAHLVVFFGASSCLREVHDWICGNCSCCLIRIG